MNIDKHPVIAVGALALMVLVGMQFGQMLAEEDCRETHTTTHAEAAATRALVASVITRHVSTEAAAFDAQSAAEWTAAEVVGLSQRLQVIETECWYLPPSTRLLAKGVRR